MYKIAKDESTLEPEFESVEAMPISKFEFTTTQSPHFQPHKPIQ